MLVAAWKAGTGKTRKAAAEREGCKGKKGKAGEGKAGKEEKRAEAAERIRPGGAGPCYGA